MTLEKRACSQNSLPQEDLESENQQEASPSREHPTSLQGSSLRDRQLWGGGLGAPCGAVGSAGPFSCPACLQQGALAPCPSSPDTRAAERGCSHDPQEQSAPVGCFEPKGNDYRQTGACVSPASGPAPRSLWSLLPLLSHSSPPSFLPPFQSHIQRCHKIDRFPAAQNRRFSP